MTDVSTDWAVVGVATKQRRAKAEMIDFMVDLNWNLNFKTWGFLQVATGADAVVCLCSLACLVSLISRNDDGSFNSFTLDNKKLRLLLRVQ